MVTVQVRLVLEKPDALLEVPVTRRRVTAWGTEDRLIKVAETGLTQRTADGVGIFYQDCG